MTNPYEQFGHNFVTRKSACKPRVVQSEKNAPMVLHGAAKEIAEQTAQLRRYRQAWRTEIQTLLDGPHGNGIHNLTSVLRNLTPDSAPVLLRALETMQWFKSADRHTRSLVLGIISEAIIRMREREGLPPFDDSLLDEPPTVFEICRSKLDIQPR